MKANHSIENLFKIFKGDFATARRIFTKVGSQIYVYKHQKIGSTIKIANPKEIIKGEVWGVGSK